MNSKPSALLLLFSLFFTFTFTVEAQDFHRISADFTIKEKKIDGSYSLMKGRVYYDKTFNKIVYKMTFPVKQTMVYHDTLIYIIKDGKLKEKKKVPSTNEFSVFHLSLNSQLTNYGLANSQYTVGEVNVEDDLVMTTWFPPRQLKKVMGKTVVAQKDKRLYGIVFYDKNDELIGKQFFRKYQEFEGLQFPTEIVQVTIKEGKEYYKTTNFENIKVNGSENDDIYDYKLDDI